jgi:hypothetical protein
MGILVFKETSINCSKAGHYKFLGFDESGY